MTSQGIMAAVTLWQPWACLVEIGAKPYETRGFDAARYGLLHKRIAIHAAKRPCAIDFPRDVLDDISDAFGRCGWNYDLPRGVIVCTAFVKRTAQIRHLRGDIVELMSGEEIKADSFGDYRPDVRVEGKIRDRWIWELTDIRPVTPHVLAIGRQQIGWPWEPPEWFRDETAAAIERAAKEMT